MKKKYDTMDFALVLIIFSSLGIVVGLFGGELSMEKAVIEHGCGQYNPTTSDFEWLGESK